MIVKADYHHYKESADYISKQIGGQPDIALILGSGLGNFADELSDKIIIPYKDIPNFPVSTVPFHKGEFVYGKLNGKNILAMSGRIHYYEGYEMWQTAYPVGVFKLLNINKLILTNATGGISEDYDLGELVCVTDHIKLTPDSPVRGMNISEFGDRFFDMQNVYNKNYINLAHVTADKLEITLKNGIYGYMAGPQFETPSEIKMLKKLGATLVGMSTVSEVIMASHCGIPVLCISCVSNMAAGITGAAITHEEVVETGKLIADKFKRLISEIIKEL